MLLPIGVTCPIECFSHFLDLLWVGYLILAVWGWFFIYESKNMVASQYQVT